VGQRSAHRHHQNHSLALRIVSALPLGEPVVVGVVVVVTDVVVGTGREVIVTRVGVVVVVTGVLVTIGRRLLGPRAGAVAAGVLHPGAMSNPGAGSSHH